VISHGAVVGRIGYAAFLALIIISWDCPKKELVSPDGGPKTERDLIVAVFISINVNLLLIEEVPKFVQI